MATLDKLRTLPVIPLMILTFSTGIVDAVGYLGLDKVFAGNMTGNVVILGMAIAGADLPVLGPLVALGAFMVGAAACGRALRGSSQAWTSRTRAVLLCVGVLLGVSAVGVGNVSFALFVTLVLALSMGAQAAAARHVKVADVTTVVVTSTITGLSADSWFGHNAAQPWARRAAAIALMLLGALIGALLLRLNPMVPLAVSAVLTLLCAALFPVQRRD
jgi:uncharacterized membrane protein YoaK (UPF0700 family)